MNTLFSKRPTYLSKNGLRTILALMLLAATLTFGAFSFAPTAHAASTPASLKSSAACPSTIQSGSTGSLVRVLQSELNGLYLNYSDSRWFENSPYDFNPYSQDPNNPLRVDGDFGSRTSNAVKDYQSWNNLTVDGIVGPQTWSSLGKC
jgi:peptidoglycan hydrolase-like protein with peptidoglycan-binding domain